jgi:hypothetical protein
MYSGRLMDDLMELVARAERNAQPVQVQAEDKPELVSFIASRFGYDNNQQYIAGVA